MLRYRFPAVLMMAVTLLFHFNIQAEKPASPQIIKNWVNDLNSPDEQVATIAHTQLLKLGMHAHDALMEGTDESSTLRSQLRQKIRQQRDQALLDKGLVVHEWGAITFIQNRKGARIGTFTDDPSDLPGFVELWSRQPVRTPQVMIKPIIYFYPKKEMKIEEVRIDSRQGIFTQWYPQVDSFQPERRHDIPTPDFIKDGQLVWKNLLLMKSGNDQLREVSKEHPWWHHARNVDAWNLSTKGSTEKFLFYRGANTLPADATVHAQKEPATYLIKNHGSETLHHLILVHVHDDKARYAYLRQLPAEQSITLNVELNNEAEVLSKVLPKQKALWQELLEERGLFPKEAAGLTKIWGDEFLGTEGLRLLYFMPPEKSKDFLKVSIKPAPVDFTRTLIVRVESASPYLKERIAQLIKDLASPEHQVRQAADQELRRVDHFAEAMLREEIKKIQNLEVRERVLAILKDLDQRRSKFNQP